MYHQYHVCQEHSCNCLGSATGSHYHPHLERICVRFPQFFVEALLGCDMNCSQKSPFPLHPKMHNYVEHASILIHSKAGQSHICCSVLVPNPFRTQHANNTQHKHIQKSFYKRKHTHKGCFHAASSTFFHVHAQARCTASQPLEGVGLCCDLEGHNIIYTIRNLTTF